MLLLNPFDCVEADVTVSKIDSNKYYMICIDFSTKHTLIHIHSVINDKEIDDVYVTNVTTEMDKLSVGEPKSKQLLEIICIQAKNDFPHSTHKK